MPFKGFPHLCGSQTASLDFRYQRKGAAKAYSPGSERLWKHSPLRPANGSQCSLSKHGVSSPALHLFLALHGPVVPYPPVAPSQERAQRCSAPYRASAGLPAPSVPLLGRGDYQAASHAIVIITLKHNKSVRCNKLRQGSLLTLHAANSFIVTAGRQEFSFLGRAEEAVTLKRE